MLVFIESRVNMLFLSDYENYFFWDDFRFYIVVGVYLFVFSYRYY